MWRLFLLSLGLILGVAGPACQRPSSAGRDAVEMSSQSRLSGEPLAPGAADPPSSTSDSVLDVEQIAQRLEENGWDRAAAQKVADLNLPYLRIVLEHDPEQYQMQLAELCRLGAAQYHGLVQDLLTQSPELAGLLAASAEVAPDGPVQIAKSIPSDVLQRQVVLSLYQLRGVADDAVEFAKLLNTEGELVLRLDNRGAWAAVDLLMDLPVDREARSVYRQWVRDVLVSALNSPDDEALASTITLLSIHAPAVRQLLEKDQQFRADFLPKWWPIFARQLQRVEKNDELWGIIINDSRVWTFFHQFQERGADLWQARGWVAIELLLDEELYADCREQIFAALEKGDELALRSLLDDELRRQPLFRSLLKRRLPPGTVAKALNELRSQRVEAPALLAYWAQLSDQALIEELGPPPEGLETWLPLYSLHYLGRKWSQGRHTDAWDWVDAAVDVVSLGLEMGPALKGVAPPLLRQAAAEAIEKGVAEGSARQIVRQSGPWGLRQLFRATVKTLATRAARAAQIDITKAVRLAFGRSGLGRSTFKRLTGLEARVFMRADRRVVIDLPKLVSSNHPIAIYLRETAENAGFDLAADTPLGKQISEGVVGAAQQAADQLQAWKAHASAWWLAVNHDMLGSEEVSQADSK